MAGFKFRDKPPTYADLAQHGSVGWVKKVFGVIAKRAGVGYVADGARKPIAHKMDDLDEIRAIMLDEVRAGYARDGVAWQSVTECRDAMTKDTKQIVQDGFFNPMTGIGTSDDPGRYNFATTPVVLSPQEATAYYSSGGVPGIIVDKKSKGILLSGYGFKGEGWTPTECKQLHEHAESKGFGEAVVNGLRDGLIYGGSVLYPAFKKDNVLTVEQATGDLLSSRTLDKDCIDHFVVADRWNTVLVPNWDVTARDYLYPSHYYIPIGGVKVATARSAVIRPKMLPYWGALRQLGWGISDYESYIRSILGYQIIVASIPIMAQQMSLLIHELPLDGIIAQDGVEAAKQFIQENVQAMREWSMANPRTVNSFGKVSAVERSYEGFSNLVTTIRQDIAAGSGIPESVLFHTQPTGFSDNKEDVLLKQSETIRLVQVSITPQLAPVARIIAISCFGPTPAIMAKLNTLAVTFETPIIRSAETQAESGERFSLMVKSLVEATIPIDLALKLTKLFFQDIEIPKDIMDRLAMAAPMTAVPQGFTPAAGLRLLAQTHGLDIIRELATRAS